MCVYAQAIERAHIANFVNSKNVRMKWVFGIYK